MIYPGDFASQLNEPEKASRKSEKLPKDNLSNFRSIPKNIPFFLAIIYVFIYLICFLFVF